MSRAFSFTGVVPGASTTEMHAYIEQCIPGYANIFLTGEHEDQYGKKIHDYQFNYVLGGSSFARTLNEEKPHRFLASELGLAEDDLERVMRDLSDARHTVIRELDIPEQETRTLGLEQATSDFVDSPTSIGAAAEMGRSGPATLSACPVTRSAMPASDRLS